MGQGSPAGDPLLLFGRRKSTVGPGGGPKNLATEPHLLSEQACNIARRRGRSLEKLPTAFQRRGSAVAKKAGFVPQIGGPLMYLCHTAYFVSVLTDLQAKFRAQRNLIESRIGDFPIHV